MQPRKRTLLLAIVLSSAFASVSAAQTTLRYQFKEKDTLNYLLEEKYKLTMKLMGMDVDTKMTRTFDMDWTVLKMSSQGAEVQIKVKYAKIDMDGPMGKVEVDSKSTKELDDPIGKAFGQMAKAMATMEITGTILPTGEMKGVKVSEESLKAMKNLSGADKLGDALNPDAFKSVVTSLVLPTEAVIKGKTWSNKVENKTPLGKTITDITYTYEGPAEKDAGLEKISLKPAIKIEADANAQIKVEIKDAKGSGAVLFDNKTGRLVESVMNQRTEMALSAGGLNFNQVIDQTVTLRLKKK